MDTPGSTAGPAERLSLSTSATSTPVRPQPALDLSSLTDEQRRGGGCAFCGIPVSTGSAVDLGERRDSEGVRVFPRAHAWCVAVAR